VSRKLENLFYRFIRENWGKLLGGLAGLLMALVLVFLGFWKGILIIILVMAGIYIGGKIEKKEIVQDFLNRLFDREPF
jgi:uncharacterized membrane protein